MQPHRRRARGVSPRAIGFFMGLVFVLTSALLSAARPTTPARESPGAFPVTRECRSAWSPLHFFDGDEKPLVYTFTLQQAVESKFLGDSTRIESAQLLLLADRTPESAYVQVQGNVVLRPACRARGCGQKKGGDSVIEARLQNIRVVCDSSLEHHATCLQKFAPLEAASSVFWFNHSPDTGMVHGVRAPFSDPNSVSSFKRSLAESLGMTSGNCSAAVSPDHASRIFEITERDGGHHGSDPERKMRFHSMRVHRIFVGDAGASVITRASSHGLYALDVHGKTRSGRSAPHHFVHSSIELAILKQSWSNRSADKVRGISATGCCSSAGLQARYDSGQVSLRRLQDQAHPSFLGIRENRRRRRQAESALAKGFTFKDLTKFVTATISMIDGARSTIKKGSVLLGRIIGDIDEMRVTLLDDATSSACKQFAFSDQKVVEPTENAELWCLCDFKANRQISSKALCLKPDYERYPRLENEPDVAAETVDRNDFCKWDQGKCHPKEAGSATAAEIYEDEAGTPSLMTQGINSIDAFIDELEEHVGELRDTATRHLDEEDPTKNLYASLKNTKFMETLDKKLTSVPAEFGREIREQLNRMKEQIPIIVKNLEPLSNLLANIMKKLGPVAETVQKAATVAHEVADSVDSAAASAPASNSSLRFAEIRTRGRKPSADRTVNAKKSVDAGIGIVLSNLPKSFAKQTKQWTESQSYQKLFSHEKGLLPSLIKALDYNDDGQHSSTKALKRLLAKLPKAQNTSQSATATEAVGSVPIAKARENMLDFITVHSKSDALFAQAKHLPAGSKSAGRGLQAQLTLWLEATVDDVHEYIQTHVQKAFFTYQGQLAEKFAELEGAIKKKADAGAKSARDLILDSNGGLIAKAEEAIKMLRDVRDRVDAFRDTLNEILKHKLDKVRTMHRTVEATVVRQIDTYIQKFIEVFSDGRSFSKRTEYSTGLMKGWVATGFAEATAQVTVLPRMAASARASVGIDYHALKPQRRGNLLEFYIEPSVEIRNVSGVLKAGLDSPEGIVPKPVFSPPIDKLIPMLSVMGGPAIPLSSDPVNILESVFPQVQKRVMEGLSDTSFWFPIIAVFVRGHLMQVPAIQRALGGLAGALGSGGDDGGEGGDGFDLQNIQDRLVKRLEERRAFVCGTAIGELAAAGEDAVKARVISIEEDAKESLVSAFRAPWDVLKNVLSILDKIAPHILSAVKVVSDNRDQLGFRNVHPLLCKVQETMLSGAEKACTLLDSVVESLSPGAGTAGAGVETLAQLMGETASKISCGKEAAAEHARKLRDLHGMLQNRTQETLSSMFKVCTAVKNVDPAIQGCGDDRLSGTKSFGEKSQNFIEDVLELAKMIKPLTEEHGDALTAFKADSKGEEENAAAQKSVVSTIEAMMMYSSTFAGSVPDASDLSAPIPLAPSLLPAESLAPQDAGSSTEPGQTAAAIEGAVADKDAWITLARGLLDLRTEFKQSPILTLLRHGADCRGVVTASANTVTDLVDDFKSLQAQVLEMVQGGESNPEKLLESIAELFARVEATCDKNLVNLGNIGSAFATCETALATELPSGGGASNISDITGGAAITKTVAVIDRGLSKAHDLQAEVASEVQTNALLLVRSMQDVVPFLKVPLTKVKSISSYLQNALLCAQGLIPPIRQSVKVITELLDSESKEATVIAEAGERIRQLFDGPLACARPSIYAPLATLLPPPPKRASKKLDKMQRKFDSAQREATKLATRTANAITKAVPMVSNLIRAGIRVYGMIRDLVALVRKYSQSLKTPGAASGGFSQAAKEIRAFKTGLTEIVLAMREVRSILELLPLDEDTIVRVFETAERTMVGIEAGCDQIIEMMMSNSMPATPPKSSGGEHSTLLMEMKGSRHMLKRLRHRSAKALRAHRTKRAAVARSREIDAESKITDMEQRLQEGMERMEKLQTASADELKIKLDDLQSTADNIAFKTASGDGGGGGGGAGGDGEASQTETETEKELRRAASKFQQRLLSMERSLECPATHFEVEGAKGQEQIAEKEMDLLVEQIIVPPELTYGIDIKVGIMVRAVGTLSINHIMCDCSCGESERYPCSEILKVGPSVAFHIIGTGTASVGVKILKISGTMSVQIGSLFLNSALNLGRVALEHETDGNGIRTPRNMCVKELPTKETAFGMAVTTSLDGEMMSADFSLSATILGFTFRKTKAFKGIARNLASLCFQPSEHATGIRRLEPRICPARNNPDIIIEPQTLRASVRPDADSAHKRCSICTIEPDKERAGWRCRHSIARILAMAGATELEDIKGIGSHFQSLLSHQRRPLTVQASKPDMGYFNPVLTAELLENWKLYSAGGAQAKKAMAPHLDRLFTSSGAARKLKYNSDISKSPLPSEFKYISNIFLCSEAIAATKTQDLAYTGKIYVKYSLNHELKMRALKMKSGATVVGSFKDRYDFQQKRVHDASTTFFVPFSFKVYVPAIKSQGRTTYQQRQKEITNRDGQPGERDNWVKDGEITWVSESKEGGGAKIEFKMLKLASTPAELSARVNNALVCDWPGAPPIVNGPHAAAMALKGDNVSSLNVSVATSAFLEESGPNYPPPPQSKKEAALWTKTRCDACCEGEGSSAKSKGIKVYAFEGNDVDGTKRKCRDGEVTTSRMRLMMKSATNEMCQNHCPEKATDIIFEGLPILRGARKHRKGRPEENKPEENKPATITTTETIVHVYQESPEKGKEAGWTEIRCKACCDEEKSNKMFTYTGELRDESQTRKCKNGRTTTKTTARRPANDQECKRYCPKEPKRRMSKIQELSPRLFHKTAKALKAGKINLDEITIAKNADPDSASPKDLLTLDLYQSVYTMPDLISEYITKDWILGKADKTSKESMMVLPSKTNKFQVTVDEFGTARPGTSRDLCQRSWIFPKRLREEHICRVLTSEDVCKEAMCAWKTDEGICSLLGVDSPAEPLAADDLFENGVANRITSTEICRRIKAFAQNDLDSEFSKETRKRRQFPSYSAMRYTAIAALDATPCDVEGNTEDNLNGFRTQQCFSCELTGSEKRKSKRWRCAVEHRREGLVDAMSSITGDWRLGSISGAGGCPRRAAAASKKYSEATYFRTLLYTQADRVAQYLDHKFTIPNEEIKSITLCGEDIRPSLRSDDENTKSKKSQRRDSPVDMRVRSFGSLCDPQATGEGCQKGLVCALVQEGETSKEEHVHRCAFEKPSIGQPCYQFKSKESWISNCASPKNEMDSRKSGENSATLKCLLNTCTLIPDKDYQRPSQEDITDMHVSGKRRFVCREDSDCPKSTRGGKGKCLKESDCAKMKLFSGRNDECTQSHHQFPNSGKKKGRQVGLCKVPDSLAMAMSKHHCVEDSECNLAVSEDDRAPGSPIEKWWNAIVGKPNHVEGKCLPETMTCVFPRSVPTCAPCSRAEENFDATRVERLSASGVCDGRRKIEQYCETCVRDEDCAEYNRKDPRSVRCGAPWASHVTEMFTDDISVFGVLDDSAQKIKKVGHKICRKFKAPGELCKYDPGAKTGECEHVFDAKSLPSRLSEEERIAVEREQDGLGCRLLSAELREKLGYDEDKGRQSGRCLFPADKSKNTDGLCLHSDECPKTTKAHCDTSKLNSGGKMPGSTIGMCVAGNGGGNTTIVAGGVETGSEEKEEHSRCSERNADLWDTEDLSKVEWQYSGIVYFKLDTTSRLEDLDNAQDEDDPSLFAMGFSLRFDLLKMAQGDFMQTVDDHENSKEASANRFLMPLLEKCGEQGTSDPFYHLCKAQSAYRSVFWDVSAARQKERTEHDPCRIDPEIDRSAYTELDSQYWFHGFQIGPHTVDGSGAVRSNKRCYICAADRANTYGKDEKNQNAVVKGLKSVGSMINTHVFNEIDYRCKTDHTGVRNSGDQKANKLMTSERVAALDLFDEEDVKKDRARQALDLIVETVLRHLYDKHVDPEFKSSDENKPSTVVKNAEGGFWARVASDQLGQGQEVGSWNEEKYVALVAVCDEVGMDNLKVKMPGIGRTQSLFPQASPSADVYGGTVCAQIGFRSHCVQYAVPFEDMMKAQGIMESSRGRKSDEAEAVINANLKIWYGDNNKPNQPGAELEIDNTGHAFFFNVFVSAMRSNFEDKDKLKKCLPKDEMQTAESLPLEDCDNRDQICKPPPELRANEGEISVNIEEGARCHSNPLNGDDADMVYAQRLVDPDTCNDLLRRHVRKNSEQIKAFVE